MVTAKIAGVPVLFNPLVHEADQESVLKFVEGAWRESQATRTTSNVLLLGIPPTNTMVETVRVLEGKFFVTSIRANSPVDGRPKCKKHEEILQLISNLRASIPGRALFFSRRAKLSCAHRVQLGEFDDSLAIIADPGPHALLAAMKAVGIIYQAEDGGEETFHKDADLLDGPDPFPQGLSPLGRLLSMGWMTMPLSNKEPEFECQLVDDFVKGVQGDEAMRASLQSRTDEWMAQLRDLREKPDSA